MKSMKNTAAALAACAALAAAPRASAQRWVMTGVTQASSGLEGGGGRAQTMGRAQTRMRVGAELFVDEAPEDVFGAAVLLAVEPRTAFGLDGRCTRVVRERFAFSGGVLAYIQPGTLAGPLAAFEYRHPLGKGFVLSAGPEMNVLVLGNDLPDKTVIWQALFHVGLRVSL